MILEVVVVCGNVSGSGTGSKLDMFEMGSGYFIEGGPL